MRRERTLLISFAFLATFALSPAVLLGGCGGGGGGGGEPACEAKTELGECPNICGEGIGVAQETCGGTSDCGCGLFCKGGECAPYEGQYAGCTCEQVVVEPGTDASTDGTGGGTTDTTTTPDTTGPVDDCPKLTPVNSATQLAWVCNPYCQTGCPDDQACTYSNGAGICFPPGTADMGEGCTGNSCLAGHACIQFNGDAQATCRRFCSDDSECGADRKCSLTVNGEFTVCSEPTVGCDLFADPANACGPEEGCYYNNQASQCMPAGTKLGGDVVMGTCVGSDMECMGDSQCTACDGYVPDANQQPGVCLGADKVCNSHEECQQCEGYIASAAEDIMGTCASDGATACMADGDCQAACEGYQAGTNEVMGACSHDAAIACVTDAECEGDATCDGFVGAVEAVPGACQGSEDACTADADCPPSTCDGYVAAGTEVMGVCSDGMDPANACTDSSECEQMCEGLVEATNETPGVCAYDGATACTAANPCVSSCDGYVPGGVGEICDGANDCVPGLQCLVVCTDICSLDGSAGMSCMDCPAPEGMAPAENVSFMNINSPNNMGICIDENIPAACDLYNQTGCGGGEACYSLRGGHGCLGAGIQAEGTECKFSNDCTGGNLCINSMCMEACDAKADPSAPESCDVKCNGTTPGTLTPAVWGVGFCQDADPAEPCSFWQQDCTGGKVCYGTSLGEACLTPDGTAGEGDSCTRNQDCAPGLVCPGSNSPNANKCTRPCSVVIPDFEGSGAPCSSNADCGLPESCLGTKCMVPYCADDCPAAAAEPVSTDSQIGTCSQQ